MIYFVPENPASPVLSLSCLRSRARRAGYRIQADHGQAGTFSLFDARLHLPIAGLDHVGLAEIARAVEAVRNT
jgi:hypothetical protein